MFSITIRITERKQAGRQAVEDEIELIYPKKRIDSSEVAGWQGGRGGGAGGIWE